MRIVICDDDLNELQKTSSFITEYCDKLNIPLDLLTYNNPKDLINFLSFDEGENKIDAYFLDIVMPINGIEVGKKIREFDRDGIIIYITTSREFAVDAFEVKAYDYIIKPFDKESFNKKLDDLTSKLNIQLKNTFSFKTSDLNIVSIEINQIAYIELVERRMMFHLTNGEFIYSPILKNKFINSIPFDFVLYNFINCHVSYIVNMNQIKEIKGYTFVLKDNSIVPISLRNFAQVKKQYINYLVGD